MAPVFAGNIMMIIAVIAMNRLENDDKLKAKYSAQFADVLDRKKIVHSFLDQ